MLVLVRRRWVNGFQLFEIEDALASRAVGVAHRAAPGYVREARDVRGFRGSLLQVLEEHLEVGSLGPLLLFFGGNVPG